jgi:hypothetical protein
LTGRARLTSARLLVLAWSLCVPLLAQDATVGVTMPITASADTWTTHRRQRLAPSNGMWDAGFRAMFYPSAKLGSHWFAYSAIQVNSYPLFYYQTYYPSRNIDTSLVQALVGYTKRAEGKAFSLKAGKLASAFGSFPLRYDDTVNPLLDVPLTYYGAYVALRPDQLPCGVPDLVRQVHYFFTRFNCGGVYTSRPNAWPVTMYGLPAVELDLTLHKLDARFQLTNSSPANPQTLRSGNQHAQWTAGGGYTIRQGFRVGVSGFRGPFLEKSIGSFLPSATTVGDYPATGIGLESQWALARWSANGEWTWFQFQYPGFVTAPAVYSGFAELKTTLSPRFFSGIRASYLKYNRPEDAQIRSSTPWQPTMQQYEFSLGFHVNHFQTLKIGYELQKTAHISGSRYNVFGLQFVTSINSLSKAIK